VLKLILIILFFFTVSCSKDDNDQYTNNQNVYDDNKLEDYELFELAREKISANQLELSLIQLNKIQVIYPSSKYANKSMLLTAYIHFLKKDYEKTRAIAENYKKYYPGSDDIIYANYLEAMTYYITMKKSDYGQQTAVKALKKFNFILNAYPNSKYEIDIITKIEKINNNLAQGKIKTAKFYLNKKNESGALVYLLEIFNYHNSSSSIEEALFYLSKIYFEIKEYDLAKKYAAILAYNFPNSEWYRKSYNVINELEDLTKEEKWYEKFNPIKIFRQDKKNNSNDSSIQFLE
tara:strand:+ start:822 stop:1694 length:873 start_codon:yes stop_codon:yes gene_type:complete